MRRALGIIYSRKGTWSVDEQDKSKKEIQNMRVKTNKKEGGKILRYNKKQKKEFKKTQNVKRKNKANREFQILPSPVLPRMCGRSVLHPFN